MKSVLGVVQGHLKLCRWIDLRTYCWSYIVSIALSCTISSYLTLNNIVTFDYSCVRGHWRSYNGTSRKLGYSFLIAFHGRILYHLRDKARNWSKIPVELLPYCLVWRKTTRQWQKFDDIFNCFDTISACDGRTDRRTDRHLAQHSLRYSSTE